MNLNYAQQKKSSYLQWFIGGGITLAIISVLVIRTLMMQGLPYDEMFLSSYALVDSLEIPPRPGIAGIIITGPKIEPVYFKIDVQRAGLRKLDWDEIVAWDRTADVKIRATITDDGSLVFDEVTDVYCPGHTSAGRIIASVVKTWAYTPYKTGTIRFWFNVASTGQKLTIDVRGLKRKPGIPGKIDVFNGLLYYIDGLSRRDVNSNGIVRF
ncbi:hypothetical protein DRQ12_09870 [candidate division KSB1 bacterium]|nr:hypothetical protein [bacterium]RKY76525.1 MAG: hypothetical protein DRQ12_09870 [candidate division KSB1 bacterium]